MSSPRRTMPAVIIFTILSAVFVLAPEIAVAAQASADWVKPATGLIESLQSGLVQAGAVLVGLAVVARGIFIAVSGNPDWQKIGMVIFGGVLIMTGPKIITTLLELAKG